MRLDHFLPFLRKRRKNEVLAPPSHALRLAKRLLPDRVFADPVTGKPGLVRNVLATLGPTVVSSPMRRAIQSVCFVVFLWLFFYVCWPYSARPAAPARISTGWQLKGINQDTGELHFARQERDDWDLAPGQLVHVVDENAQVAADGYAAVGNVTRSEDGQAVLAPHKELVPEQLDKLLLTAGPWSLWEEAPGRWPSHYTDELEAKEIIPADLFLAIDPLVSLSTFVASRSWIWSLTFGAVILVACVAVPRGFCGYLCPLGTLIDLVDWGISQHITLFRVPATGWWVHIKYYLLLGTLVCAVFGVLLSGFVAAIPVITRGLLFIAEPLQSGLMRGWHQVPAMNLGHFVSIFLFVVVLGLGLLKPRFWCKYVCPSGAVFSLGNLLRTTERKVESTCIHCNKCVEICPFDAIKPDFTTRTTDCTFCQTCGGACPVHSIKFVERWNTVQLKASGDPPTRETALGRRGFMSLAVGTLSALMGGVLAAGVTRDFGAKPNQKAPVRPPGSVPEREFLRMCIRCAECFKVCPNNVLQPMSFQHGLEPLWTPQVEANWAGCESSCNACGQVCPTGAIRALPLHEKKVARMGLAVVNQTTCLPFADRAACQLCVDECSAAGYHAIEFTRVNTTVDDSGRPVEGTGYVAPVVLSESCVGCGLCQTRCFHVNVADQRLLKESAIVIEAGDGKEDRMMSGSYARLREDEARRRQSYRNGHQPPSAVEYVIPESDTANPGQPFGIAPTEPARVENPQDAGPPADPFGLDDG